MEIKPGWKTTEFWMTAGAQLLSLLVLFGIVSVADKATLEGAITKGIENVGALVTSALTIWTYIQSRMKVKEVVVGANLSLANSPQAQTLPASTFQKQI